MPGLPPKKSDGDSIRSGTGFSRDRGASAFKLLSLDRFLKIWTVKMVNRIVKKEKDTRRRNFERRGHIVFSINDIRITETSSFVKPEGKQGKDKPYPPGWENDRLGEWLDSRIIQWLNLVSDRVKNSLFQFH